MYLLYRLGELDEAEDALTEANILHNLDPEVWAYLSLVCLRTNRPIEAEQAYKYAVKVSYKSPLLKIIANIVSPFVKYLQLWISIDYSIFKKVKT